MRWPPVYVFFIFTSIFCFSSSRENQEEVVYIVDYYDDIETPDDVSFVIRFDDGHEIEYVVNKSRRSLLSRLHCFLKNVKKKTIDFFHRIFRYF
jgi:hypothetical protein